MSTLYAKERSLQSQIAPAVERSLPGVEVLAVELLSPSRFCVYVDHPQGVSHELCARVTSVLGSYRTDYTIDVSSPGVERPLRTPSHFAGAVGHTVSVRTEAEVAGRKRFRGEVLAADNNGVELAVAGGDPLRIPYDVIVRSNLIDEGLRS